MIAQGNALGVEQNIWLKPRRGGRGFEMPIPSIILDTSVIVSALRSTVGASYQLVDWIDAGRFVSYISNSMIYEYVEVSHRLVGTIRLNQSEIDDILNYVIGSSRQARVYYVWRPVVKDPNDDFVAEAAICSNCDYIITHNVRDFQGLDSFGVKVITPGEMVRLLKGVNSP